MVGTSGNNEKQEVKELLQNNSKIKSKSSQIPTLFPKNKIVYTLQYLLYRRL